MRPKSHARPTESEEEHSAQLLLLSGKSLAVAGKIPEAFEVLEQVLDKAHLDSPTCADALDWLSWLSWIELDGPRTEAYAKRMLRLATPPTSPEAFRLFVRKATQSLQLGDAKTALRIIEEAEQVSRDADIESFVAYLSIRADIFAALGQAKEALNYAQLAADIARRRPDSFNRWRRLEYLGYIQYANCLLADALATFRQAEDVARSSSLSWEVPFSKVRAAWIAALLGSFDEAATAIRDSFNTSERTQWMVVTRAWVGLEIGLAVGDEDLVARCTDNAYLETAFASGDSYTRARTAGAFCEYYIRRGETLRATTLLQQVVPRLRSPDSCWSLFAPIAAYGDTPLIEHAQMLLASLPSDHAMARAHQLLFAAVFAARTGSTASSARFAGEAYLCFERLQHHYQAARCLELAGRLSEAHQRYTTMGAHYDASRTALVRQRRGRPPKGYEIAQQRREVIDLLVAGETIKTIAERLGVSVRTVKARVAEIYQFEGVGTRSELKARKRQ